MNYIQQLCASYGQVRPCKVVQDHTSRMIAKGMCKQGLCQQGHAARVIPVASQACQQEGGSRERKGVILKDGEKGCASRALRTEACQQAHDSRPSMCSIALHWHVQGEAVGRENRLWEGIERRVGGGGGGLVTGSCKGPCTATVVHKPGIERKNGRRRWPHLQLCSTECKKFLKAVIAVAAAEIHFQVQPPLALQPWLDCLRAIRAHPDVEPVVLCMAGILAHVSLVAPANLLHHPAQPMSTS